jgi:hypothetical protein
MLWRQRSYLTANISGMIIAYLVTHLALTDIIHEPQRLQRNQVEGDGAEGREREVRTTTRGHSHHRTSQTIASGPP